MNFFFLEKVAFVTLSSVPQGLVKGTNITWECGEALPGVAGSMFLVSRGGATASPVGMHRGHAHLLETCAKPIGQNTIPLVI